MSRDPVRITSVVTRAASYDLIDLATLKTLLGIGDNSNDAYLKLTIAQASAAVARFCDRPFVVETIQDQIWPFRDGSPGILRGGIAPLQVARWPIVSIGSVVETIATVPTTLTVGVDFIPDLTLGQLTRLDAGGYPTAWRSHAIAVTYTAGYAAIPFDVVDAVARLIKAAWFARSRDPMLRSQSAPGVYEAQYWFGSGPASNAGLPPDVAALLDTYRMPVMA